jgi:hypothetical protein
MGTGELAYRHPGDGPAVQNALLAQRDLIQLLGQTIEADIRLGEGYLSALAALGAQQMHPILVFLKEPLSPEIFFWFHMLFLSIGRGQTQLPSAFIRTYLPVY